MNESLIPSAEAVTAATRKWLEKAVIGLNLCPFAKAAYVQQRVHIAVTDATTEEALLEALARELDGLQSRAADERETTLLVLPQMLEDFLDYNDFLGMADDLVEELELTGEIQIASFHPRYQFAGTRPDDITNHSNRSPYPMLHLLREASVEAAVESYPNVDDIPERNIATLRGLGREGWDALWAEPKP